MLTTAAPHHHHHGQRLAAKMVQQCPVAAAGDGHHVCGDCHSLVGSLAHMQWDITENRWRGKRSQATGARQLEASVRTIEELVGKPSNHIMPAEVLKQQVKLAVRRWEGEDYAQATIYLRLVMLGLCGVNTRDCAPDKDHKLKWWLTPQNEEKLIAWLLDIQGHHSPILTMRMRRLLADYIVFTTRTGFRVEECLRLRWDECSLEGKHPYITVPGTKTENAQATLPISVDVAAVLALRKERVRPTSDAEPVFKCHYLTLREAWNECRVFLGAEANPLATLKALRRSAARYLHIGKGMPLDMLRGYLRHSDIKTTQGYLKLVGGYADEEMRKWL